MAFDEVQLDPKISYGAVGGPRFKTTVVAMDSGGEQRISQWVNGRLSWNISTGVKSAADMTAIIAFFRARHGKARGFRFKDWTDYKANLEPFTAASDPLRLYKTYTDAGYSEVRLIKKPVTGTVHIYTDSGGSTAATGWTLDYTTGIVTGLSTGTTYYWTGQFDVPARFDTDDMQFTMTDFTTQNWDSIPVVELLLPN